MSAVLAVVALVVLGGLVFVSIMRQRETAAAEKGQARSRASQGEAQLERSMSRRAEARATSLPASTSRTDPPGAGPARPGDPA